MSNRRPPWRRPRVFLLIASGGGLAWLLANHPGHDQAAENQASPSSQETLAEPRVSSRPPEAAGSEARTTDDLLEEARVLASRMQTSMKSSRFPSREDSRELRRLISLLPATELLSLASMIAETGDPKFLGNVGPTMGHRLVTSDLETSTLCAWLREIDSPTGRRHLLAIIGATLPAVRGLDGTTLLDQFPDEDDRTSFLRGYAGSVSQESPEHALQVLLDHLPPDADRHPFEQVLALLPANANFGGLTRALVDSGDERAIASTDALLKGWARFDPEEACLFAFEADHISAPDAANAAGRWTRSDPRRVRDWMETLPGGPKRDEVVRAYTIARAAMEPEEACGLAQSITDPEIRRSALEQIHENWRRYAPQAADRMMEGIQQ